MILTNTPHPDLIARGITFRESTLSDIPELARIWVEGHKSEPSMRLRYADLPDDNARKALEQQEYKLALEELRRRQLDKECITEVVECDGRIIGMASWRVEHRGRKPFGIDTPPLPAKIKHRMRSLSLMERLINMKNLAKRVMNFIAPSNASVNLSVDTKVKEDPWVLERAERILITRHERERAFAFVGDMVLDFIGVIPDYRRKGIATQLIRWECHESDRDDTPITVAVWNDPAAEALFDKVRFDVAARYRIETGGEEERIMQYGAVQGRERYPSKAKVSMKKDSNTAEHRYTA